MVPIQKPYVIKRGNSWYYRITVGKTTEGKRKTKSKGGFRTKREAVNAATELLILIKNGHYNEYSQMPFGEFMEQFLTDKKLRIRPSTLEQYTWAVRKQIIPAIGDVPLGKLKPFTLQEFYNNLAREGKVSSMNLRKIHTLIKAALKKAVRWELIDRNVAELLDAPREEKSEIVVWDLDQAKKFISFAESYPYYLAFLLAITTGARQGEILGLRWKDVDLERGIISIVQTLSHDGKRMNPAPKTKAGRRTLSLPTEVTQELKRWKGLPDHLVVQSKADTPINPRNLNRQFKNIIEKAELPNIRFHDLRHTHATLLLLQGVHPKIVAERLGHANTRMTLDTYSHLLPNMQQEAAEKFGQIFFT
ncbi:tyrosine-type recombinase/integrase [Brevibacillus sp. SYSU BS000544]|uniref:tyrosine-type recombinase/integrase n=1 Tax=Brevibacillus sp. SYSU BS000544 TaxID=3416443 RepID=UPI003CE53227